MRRGNITSGFEDNIILSSTFLDKYAEEDVISAPDPSLEDKLTANAVRVPTPNGSLAILSLSVKKATTVEEINNLLRDEALNGGLINQINYFLTVLCK